MKIIHHDDLDGRASAAIVLIIHPDAECIEVDYATDIPFKRIEKDEDVFVVDFSLRDDDWLKLWIITTSIVWIDHHETSIKKAESIVLEYLNADPRCAAMGSCLPGVRSKSRCGAYLTWEYLMNVPTPPIIQLIDKWDRWVHEDSHDVLDFISGIKLYEHSPTDIMWPMLFAEETRDAHLVSIQRKGVIVRQYQKMVDAEAVQRFAYPIEWEGYKCIVLHTDKSGSTQFDSVKGQYDIMIPVTFDGKRYTVHLYSEHVKVNDIALKHGGGGHPKAAGFVCSKLPWTKQ